MNKYKVTTHNEYINNIFCELSNEKCNTFNDFIIFCNSFRNELDYFNNIKVDDFDLLDDTNYKLYLIKLKINYKILLDYILPYLNNDIDVPILTVDNDGDISLEFYGDNGYRLSIDIYNKNDDYNNLFYNNIILHLCTIENKEIGCSVSYQLNDINDENDMKINYLNIVNEKLLLILKTKK